MNFLLIFIGLTAGLILQRTPLPQIRTIVLLNRHVLWLALPATVFKYLTGLNFEWHYFWLASVAWLSFFVAWLWVRFLQVRFTLDRATTGCLLLTCGLGNTSFVGFPLLTGLYGPEVLSEAVFIDQLGSFLILSTVGIVGASFYAGKNPSAKEMVARAGKFPPLICFIIVAIMNSLDWTWPEHIDRAWNILSATLVPVALVSVGMQIKLHSLHEFKIPLLYGLGYRLIFSPLIVWVVYQGILSRQSLGVAVLEAGMASHITGSIVAGSMGLNPRLATAMVSVGTLLSFISVPVWFLLLRYLS